MSTAFQDARTTQMRRLEAENEELLRVLTGYQNREMADDDEPADSVWLIAFVHGMMAVDVWEMARTPPVCRVGEVAVGCMRTKKSGPLKVAIEVGAQGDIGGAMNLAQVVLFDPTRGQFRDACRLLNVNPFSIEKKWELV